VLHWGNDAKQLFEVCLRDETRRLRAAQVIRMVGESQEAVGVGGGSGPSSNKMPTLEEYGTNLTTQATEARPRPRGLAPAAAAGAPLPA
jgi:hypothetical protein